MAEEKNITSRIGILRRKNTEDKLDFIICREEDGQLTA